LTPEQIELVLQHMAVSPQEAQRIVLEMIQHGAHAELMQVAEAVMRLQGFSDASIQSVFQTADQATDLQSGWNRMVEAIQRAAEEPGLGLLDDSLLPEHKPPRPS
jgi:hypothetical protein